MTGGWGTGYIGYNEITREGAEAEAEAARRKRGRCRPSVRHCSVDPTLSLYRHTYIHTYEYIRISIYMYIYIYIDNRYVADARRATYPIRCHCCCSRGWIRPQSLGQSSTLSCYLLFSHSLSFSPVLSRSLSRSPVSNRSDNYNVTISSRDAMTSHMRFSKV